MNVTTVNERLVLSSPGIVIVDKIKLADELNDFLEAIFDGEPLIIPVHEDAPPEIPRIILKSKDERYKLQIAFNIFHFIADYKDDNNSEFPNFDFQERFIKIFKYLTEKIHSQFIRVARVTNWIVKLEETIGTEIMLKNFIHEEISIRKPYIIELNYLTKDSIDNLKINKWIRIKSERDTSDTSKDRIVKIKIDINTLPEEKYELSQAKLQKFLEESNKLVKNEIDLQFKRIKKKND